MSFDPTVGNVSKEAANVVCKAAELFVGLYSKETSKTTQSFKKKTITNQYFGIPISIFCYYLRFNCSYS